MLEPEMLSSGDTSMNSFQICYSFFSFILSEFNENFNFDVFVYTLICFKAMQPTT